MLQLKHPTQDITTEVDTLDLFALEVFREYVLDGWLPANKRAQVMAEKITAAEAAKQEASHV